MLGFLLSPWAKIKAFGMGVLAIAAMIFVGILKYRGRKIKELEKDNKKLTVKSEIADEDTKTDVATKTKLEKVEDKTDEELLDDINT